MNDFGKFVKCKVCFWGTSRFLKKIDKICVYTYTHTHKKKGKPGYVTGLKEADMAKKSFIDRGNPAMQFISAAREESHEKEESRPANSAQSAEKKSRQTKKEKAPERERQEAQTVKNAQTAQTAQSARSVRQAAAPAEENGSFREKRETAVRSHPVAPRRQGESKSKRVQLLVPPSLHMKVSRKAAEMELSFNEYVNQLLEKSVDNK